MVKTQSLLVGTKHEILRNANTAKTLANQLSLLKRS